MSSGLRSGLGEVSVSRTYVTSLRGRSLRSDMSELLTRRTSRRCLRAPEGSGKLASPDVKLVLQCRTGPDSRTNAVSSVSATRMTPPISRTSVSTPSSIAARSRPGSRLSTRARSTSRGRWATSPTSSTRPGFRGSGPHGHRPRPVLDGRRLAAAERPADRFRDPGAARSPSLTTATSSTPGRSGRPSRSKGALFTTTSDSEVILHLVARSQAPTLAAAIAEALSEVRGAYSLVILSRDGHLRRARPATGSGRCRWASARARPSSPPRPARST